MSTELLRDSIDRATGDPVTPPDIERLKRRGHRRSTARAGIASLTTLGVVAVGGYVVQAVMGDVTSGEVAASNRHGSTMTYISWPDQVHINGKTITVDHAGDEALGMSAATEAGFVYIGSDDHPYLVEASGTEHRIGDSTNPQDEPGATTSLSGSADARYAAWESLDDGQFAVSLFDAEVGRVVARRAIDCGAVVSGSATCDFVMAVSDGIVYLTATSGDAWFTIAWDPSLPRSEQVYRVTDPWTQVTAAAARTVMVDGSGPVYGRSGEPLSPDWDVVRVNGGGLVHRTALTIDGRWYFRFSGAEESPSEGTLSAVDVSTGRSVELVSGAHDVRMDDDGSVLVLTGDGDDPAGQSIFDCAIPSGECAAVIEGLHGNVGFAGDDS